jgi:hypothetical protein
MHSKKLEHIRNRNLASTVRRNLLYMQEQKISRWMFGLPMMMSHSKYHMLPEPFKRDQVNETSVWGNESEIEY